MRACTECPVPTSAADDRHHPGQTRENNYPRSADEKNRERPPPHHRRGRVGGIDRALGPSRESPTRAGTSGTPCMRVLVPRTDARASVCVPFSPSPHRRYCILDAARTVMQPAARNRRPGGLCSRRDSRCPVPVSSCRLREHPATTTAIK